MRSMTTATIGPPCYDESYPERPLRLACMPYPPSPKQATFMSTVNREVLMYGGGGGGKTTALLGAALQFVDVHRYAAVIVRKSLADLTMPGGLIDVSHMWLDRLANIGQAAYNANERKWTFDRSRATLTFAYIGDDEPGAEDWRPPGFASGEYQFVGFDMLDEVADPFLYRYMFSRLRRPPAPAERPEGIGRALHLGEVPLRMRATAGPLSNALPLPGNRWVTERFLPAERTDDTPPSMASSYLDNPAIDQDEYRRMMDLLPQDTAAALLGE